jgi:hypothetical protein
VLGDFWLLKLQQRMSGSVDLQKILTARKMVCAQASSFSNSGQCDGLPVVSSIIN